MKIIDILRRREQGFCFEFFPPRSKASQEAFRASVQLLRRYDPLYASMTYGAAGKNRQSSQEAVDILIEERGLEVMPHLTCVGSSSLEINGLLDDYRKKGVENIMALRGDPPQDAPDFDFKRQELPYAKDLVSLIKRDYDFCLGVAVYPEGHIESSSPEEDLEYTKQKIDAGADFAVTQMFFDNSYFYSFLERMAKKNVNIPVLPGILPLTDVIKVKQLAAVCRSTIPKHIEDKLEALRFKPLEMAKAGIDFTIAQCQDLIKNGFRQIHFFTLNKPATIKQIIGAL
jgi:methylenetetrahydrofolate reductase (NADPH)